MRGSCGELLDKRTKKYEKTADEFAEFKEIFNIVKFRRAYTLERDHYFIQTKEDLLIITKKTSDPDHNYIDEKSANGERVYNLI